MLIPLWLKIVLFFVIAALFCCIVSNKNVFFMCMNVLFYVCTVLAKLGLLLGTQKKKNIIVMIALGPAGEEIVIIFVVQVSKSLEFNYLVIETLQEPCLCVFMGQYFYRFCIFIANGVKQHNQSKGNQMRICFYENKLSKCHILDSFGLFWPQFAWTC